MTRNSWMPGFRLRWCGLCAGAAVVVFLVQGCAHTPEPGGDAYSLLQSKHPLPQPAAEPAPEAEVRRTAAVFEARACVPAGWPTPHVEREVISVFGPRGRRLHRGIDIKAPYGTPIVATAAGVVVFSGVRSGYGHLVVVDHGNDYETAYAHLDSRTVTEGDAVARGDRVGLLGRSGRTTTHHVHYEVRRDGEAVNPSPYVHGDLLSPEWHALASR